MRENQRKFFLYFAEMKGFDPLVPENWYPITNDEFKELVFSSLFLFSPSCLLLAFSFSLNLQQY